MDATQWHELANSIRPAPPPVPPDLSSRDEQSRTSAIDELELSLESLVLTSVEAVQVSRALTHLVSANTRRMAGSKTIAGITAPFSAGKTTLITEWAYELHREWVEGASNHSYPTWCPEPGITARLVPVVYLSLISSAGVKELNAQILTFLGYPGEGIARVTSGRVNTALRRHGVRLLIFDDAHMLRLDDKSSRLVLDYLKTLNSELGFLHGTMIFVGPELEQTAIFEDPQIRGRLRAFRLDPQEIGSEDGRRNWQHLLKQCEGILLPYLHGSSEGVFSSEHAAFVWHRTQGFIGDVTQLLSAGVINALRRGGRTVTRTDLVDVSLSARAHDAQANLEWRRRQGPGHGAANTP